MKKPILKRLAACALALAVTAGALGALAGTALPAKAETVTGQTVYSNAKASIDASNLAEGYLIIKYTGGKNVRIKVQIEKSGGEKYNYDLNNAGNPETFPLTEGDGTYTVKVLENTTDNRYAVAYSTTLELKLRSQFLPFLYPNQYVNFTDTSKTVAKAAEITKGKTTDVERVEAVFNWAVANISYDYDKAKTVQSGYLPDVDATLASGKGICFDYAAVMSAMLRSQNIPCKLVIGWAGNVYHAWINVYIDGVGWVDGYIQFDGQKWTLMDPTFVSSGGGSAAIKALYELTPLMGLKMELGGAVSVEYAPGYQSDGEKSAEQENWQAESLEERAYKASYKGDGSDAAEKRRRELIREAAALAESCENAVLFIGLNHEFDLEGCDRPDMKLPYGQEELISAVLDANENTVIAVTAGSPVDMEVFADRAKAIVYSSYNGMEGGLAMAEVLLGRVNPSGRLPFTIPKRLEDCPATVSAII